LLSIFKKRSRGTFPEVPCILLVNKTDLNGQWDIEDSTIEKLRHEGWDIMKTSAKTGLGVEEAFTCLAAKMLEKTIT
jgi:GTPase SAR1 family protein